MRLKDCRGSHVGMIISFVVFITFIIFMYSIVRPAISTGQDKKTIADYLVVEIIKNISSNLTSMSIELNSSNPMSTQDNCVSLVGFYVRFATLFSPRIIIKNAEGNKEEAYSGYYSDEDNIKINRTDNEDLFFKLYHSSEFPDLSDTTETCVPLIDYSIGLVKKDRIPFENNLYSLINYYNNNYEQLKTGLNVPPGTEFGFGFIQSNGTRIEVGDAPSTTDIYVAEIPMQYVDEVANIQSGFINIKVW